MVEQVKRDASRETPPQIVSRPMISIAIASLIGAAAAPAEHVTALAAAGAVSAMVTLVLALRRRIFSTFIAPLPFFLAGLVFASMHLPGPAFDRGDTLEGTIAEDPDPRLILDLEAGRASLSTADGSPWTCDQVGSRVRVLTSSRTPSPQARRLAARRGVTLEATGESGSACLVLEPPRGLDDAAALARSVSRNDGALLRTFTAGPMDPGLIEDHRRAGLAHVLYLRGLALLALFFVFDLSLARVWARQPALVLGRFDPRRTRAVVSLFGLMGLALFLGPSPTILRAASIPVGFLLPALFDRPNDPWSSMSVAAVLCTFADPASLGDVEFQLAFAGTAAVIRLEPLLYAPFARIGGRAWLKVPLHLLLASAAVAIGTLPLAARHFGPLPVLGYMASVAAVPLAIASTATAILFPPLRPLAGALAGMESDLATWTRVHLGEPTLGKPTLSMVLAYYAVLLAVSMFIRRRGASELRGP